MTARVSNHRLPCGSCGMETTKLPGIIVPTGLIGVAYHVCWRCHLFKMAGNGPGREWKRMPKLKATATKPQWRKCSPHHWQTTIQGEVLDYWPSTRKFRFQGETRVGDVNKFFKQINNGVPA